MNEIGKSLMAELTPTWMNYQNHGPTIALPCLRQAVSQIREISPARNPSRGRNPFRPLIRVMTTSRSGRCRPRVEPVMPRPWKGAASDSRSESRGWRDQRAASPARSAAIREDLINPRIGTLTERIARRSRSGHDLAPAVSIVEFRLHRQTSRSRSQRFMSRGRGGRARRSVFSHDRPPRSAAPDRQAPASSTLSPTDTGHQRATISAVQSNQIAG